MDDGCRVAGRLTACHRSIAAGMEVRMVVEVGRTRARLAILGAIPSVLASSPSGMVTDDLAREKQGCRG